MPWIQPVIWINDTNLGTSLTMSLCCTLSTEPLTLREMIHGVRFDQRRQRCQTTRTTTHNAHIVTCNDVTPCVTRVTGVAHWPPQKPTLLGYSILWLSSEPKMAPNHTMKGSMPGACPAFLSNYVCFHHPLCWNISWNHQICSPNRKHTSKARRTLSWTMSSSAVRFKLHSTFCCLLDWT